MSFKLTLQLPTIFVVILLGCLSTVAEEFEAGVDYYEVETEITEELLDEEPSDKIQVVEVFNYMCPHCYRLEREVKDWLENLPDDVEFAREAVPLRSAWVPAARAYYIAEQLDVLDDIHDLMFEAIYVSNLNMQRVEFIERLFDNRADIDPDKFQEVYKSDEILERTRVATTKMRLFNITGTPAIIIDNRFVVDARTSGDTPMFEIVDFIVEIIRAEKEDEN